MQKKHRLRTTTSDVFLLQTLVIPYTRLLTLLSKTKLLLLASHLYYLFLKVHESRIMLPSFGLLLLLFVYSFFLSSSAINQIGRASCRERGQNWLGGCSIREKTS